MRIGGFIQTSPYIRGSLFVSRFRLVRLRVGARAGAVRLKSIVGVFVAASDGEYSGAQDVADLVRHIDRIARVRDQPREGVGYPKLPLHAPSSRTPPSEVSRPPASRRHLLASHGREAEWGKVWGAESGWHARLAAICWKAWPYRQIASLIQRLVHRYIGIPGMCVNKTG